MLIEIIVALIVGVLAGTFTGLFPGIHINLVAAGLLASISYFSFVPNLGLVVFIVAMSITHTFIDFIPSIFLGVPNEDNFLSVLPGHEMLKEGKGFEAVVLTLYGGLFALFFIILFSFIFAKLLPYLFEYIKGTIPFILIFVSLYLIFREEKILIGFIVLLLSGFLGYFTFNLPVKEPLLPLLSGLFGVSGLIVSLKSKTKIPMQRNYSLREIGMDKKSFFRTGFAAAVAAPLCSFLPGIGSGQAAVIGSEIMGKEADNRRNFLFLVGAINTIVMSLSFVTAYSIQKGRTGSAAVVQEILGKISGLDLIVILIAIVISGIVAFFVGVGMAGFFSRNINKIDYGKVSWIILGLLFIVNLVLSNWIGLIVLATGSALGVFCILSGARRINLMGCLLIPSIVYYLS